MKSGTGKLGLYFNRKSIGKAKQNKNDGNLLSIVFGYGYDKC